MDPLEKAPPAVVDGQITVTLSSGKAVIVQRWNLRKKWQFCKLYGDPDSIPIIAKESVRPEDREMVEALPESDQLEIAARAAEFSMTERDAKNLLGIARAWGHLSDPKASENGSTSR